MTIQTHETVGVRVKLHPATDAWMQGDRFGTIVRYHAARGFSIRLDRSGRVLWFHSHDIEVIS